MVIVRHIGDREILGHVIGYSDQGVLVSKEGEQLRVYKPGEPIADQILFSNEGQFEEIITMLTRILRFINKIITPDGRLLGLELSLGNRYKRSLFVGRNNGHSLIFSAMVAARA